jgi:hypothetical protein
MQRLDLTGQTYGYLTVISLDRIEPNKNSMVYWNCKCKCGKDFIAPTKTLRNGNTQSCGCYQIERAKEANTIHGCASRRNGEHHLYLVWANMKARCEQPNNNRYYRYGARGIIVEPPWQDFPTFFADMNPTYKPGLTLDRKNNDKNYCKDNCKWSTRAEQARNTSTNRYLTFNGKTMILKDWAKELGVTHSTICLRLKAGWSIADALTHGKHQLKHKDHSLPKPTSNHPA